MGSLSGNGIPVVSKTPYTFTNQDGRQIVRSNSVDDTDAVLVEKTTPDRTISSGSIVRDNGAVEYTEDKVYGLYMMGRSTDERVASKVGNTRNLNVELGDNMTDAVIPVGLTPDVPQIGIKHTGNRIVHNQSVDDLVVERLANSGVYGS